MVFLPLSLPFLLPCLSYFALSLLSCNSFPISTPINSIFFYRISRTMISISTPISSVLHYLVSQTVIPISTPISSILLYRVSRFSIPISTRINPILLSRVSRAINRLNYYTTDPIFFYRVSPTINPISTPLPPPILLYLALSATATEPGQTSQAGCLPSPVMISKQASKQHSVRQGTITSLVGNASLSFFFGERDFD